MLTAKQKLLTGDHPAIPAAVDIIIAGLPPEKSGAARVQHLGVLMCMIAMDLAGDRITAKSVCDLTSMHASHVTKIVNTLMDFGLIEREQVLASHGKGYQYVYHPVMNLSRIIRKTAPVDKKRSGSGTS